MTAPTKAQIDMLNRIREEHWPNFDSAVIAAIIETQEWAAGIAEAERLRHDTGDGFDSQPCRNVAWRIREAIRDGSYREDNT
jgi:hypothetical protein